MHTLSPLIYMHAGSWSSFEFCSLLFPGPICWPICLWLEDFCRQFCKLEIFTTCLRCIRFLVCTCFPLTPSKLMSFFPRLVFRNNTVVCLFSFNALYCCKHLPMNLTAVRLLVHRVARYCAPHHLATSLSPYPLASRTIIS